MKRVVIIGGGVSGLATAYTLEKLHPDLSITIFQPGGKLGGKIQTVKRAGCTIEEGADSILLKSGSDLERIIEELGLSGDLISPKQRSFSIQRDGILHEVPLGLLRGFPENVRSLWKCSLFSLMGKLQATLCPALDYLFPSSAQGDPSIAESLRRRFGREVSRYFFETVFGGIHSGDAESLSFKSLYPDMAKRRAGGKYGKARFVSFREGMNTLPKALSSALRRTVVADSVVSSVRQDESGIFQVEADGEFFAFDYCVVATPAFAAKEILFELDQGLSAALAAIDRSSSAVVTFVISKSDVLKETRGSGYLLAPTEGGYVTGCTFSSQKWDGRAPEDLLVVRVFFGRNGGVREVADEELLSTAKKEVRVKLGVEKFQECLVTRWEQGLPQYVCGHEEKLQRIDSRVTNFPGLFLTGTSYRGVGIPDCVHQAVVAAKQLGDLHQQQSLERFESEFHEGEAYGKSVCA
ncbi:MAG: protoporphyrinogen oxidase [Bdellovibrionales bacterium]|nr:protoporphyrinogen oxidase [Bdellovibrionales bacterium]